MTGDARAAVAAEAAQTIREQAREHKRLERHHRRQSRLLMERLAALAEIGIHLDPAQSPETEA